jgi:two-component system phosphate regulon response regulator OmpR
MTAVTPVSDDAAHLLIVDDDGRLCDLLRRYLSSQGFRVTTAADAASARRRLAGFEFDGIVLDVMMPGDSGLVLLRELRAESEVPPVLLLTARSDPADRIEGLELGAADYLPKPFEPRELALRIRNMLRGSGRDRSLNAVSFGAFVFHIRREELVAGDGVIVRLTDRERHLLKIFAESPGETIARHRLITEEGSLGDRSVDVQINRLRRKIEDDPANPRYLQTIRGAGYRLLAEWCEAP